jgi:arylsulfatase A-like enzyme
MWANYLLGQFKSDIDTLLPPESFSVVSEMIGTQLGAVPKTYRAFDDFLFRDGSPPASLLFGLAHRIQLHRREARSAREAYPRGLPRAGDYPIFFDIREVYDGVLEVIRSLPSPYLAYLHLWAPHDPYKPSASFDEYFKDTWAPPIKPRHRLGSNVLPGRLFSRRKNYDEYIAEVDFEFGRLIDILNEENRLENTILVVTSDHGEMLERGVEGHITRLMYEPIVHVPLLISLPGQADHFDVQTPTNGIDVLPTLLHLTGHPIPDWCQGLLLPGFFGDQSESNRSSLMMDAKDNPAYAPLREATLAIRNENFKLIYYTGYEAEDSFELYDLEADPEELVDLVPSSPSIMKALMDELLEAFDVANKLMEHT